MRINAPAQEIILKVVYYGPGMAGKTTNLTVIHDQAPSQAAGELVMVDTHSERTLRFDLLTDTFGDINGQKVRFDFYTVPGQSYYAATRRAVLAGADGVVFVADSRREALDENIEAMNEMLNNLRHHGLADDLPVVVQYNKQDLPTAVKREQLEPLMNVRSWPSLPAIATAGQGVLETYRLIAELVIGRARSTQSTVPHPEPAPEPAKSWLISCHRCQAMLEVPDAKPGLIYACGICGSALEVVDPERGLTRVPTASPAAAPAPSPQRQVPMPHDDSGYGLQALPESASGGNLGAIPSPTSPPASVGSPPFEVAGFELVTRLDETPQGRRARVREQATLRTLRALVLNPALMRQPGYQQNLDPYVRAANQVKQPYLLPLLAMQATGDSVVLFSADPPDYEPLSHTLARRRALAPPHAMGIIRQLALALEEAARHGVVHGWLRPEVVLVSPDGNVLLDELAVPKNHHFLVRELAGASAATEYYLAPEHLNEEIRSDLRSDIFLLGALIFRMLTGEGLVTGYNPYEALHKIITTGARSLRSIQSSVSRDLDLFYQRMVAAERKDRFQGYRELVDNLDKFGGGAKRQTLRLTQNLAPPPSPMGIGTGHVIHGGSDSSSSGLRRATAPPARRATAAPARTGTGSIARSSASGVRSGTAAGARRATGPGDKAQTGTVYRRKSGGSGMAILVIILVLLAGGALAYYLVMNRPSGAKPADRKATPTAPKSATPTGAATTPAKPDQTSKPTAATTPATPAPAPTAPPPVTPAPAPVTTAAPAVAPPPPPPKPPPPTKPPADEASVLSDIINFQRDERFQEALDACAKLTNAEIRQMRIDIIKGVHDRRRQDIEAIVGNHKDIEAVRNLLTPALRQWGMPGDADWANKLLSAAEKRLGATAPPAPIPAPAPAPAAEPTPAPAPTGSVEPNQGLERATLVDGQVNLALARNQPEQALASANGLDAASLEAAAIKRKLAIWSKRGEILARALQERQPKLRVPHPTTNEQWDISGVTPTGISIISPAGSKTDLAWNQVPAKEQARVFLELAGNPAAKADEHALATVMQLIGGDPLLASVQLKKAKGVIEPEVGADLEVLIALRRRHDVLELLNQANEAGKANNARLLGECLDQLKKVEKSLQPLVAGDLPRLEDMLQRLGAGKVAVESPLKDHLTFDSADDLLSFPERSGVWQVNASAIANGGDGARLTRHDLGNARALHLIFQPLASRGTMSIDFRGVKLGIDFTANTYHAVSRDETAKPKSFTFLPKAANSIYFESRQTGMMSIEINNGAEAISLRANELGDQLVIGADSGANVAIDDLLISRNQPATGGKDAKEKQAELRKLGWEPIGGAYLDAPAIVLPALPGGTSGIALALKDNIVGVAIEAKGAGLLRLQVGNLADRSGPWIDLTLTATAQVYRAAWLNGKLTVTDALNAPVKEVALPGPHTHLMIIALQEATLVSTPRLTYQ